MHSPATWALSWAPACNKWCSGSRRWAPRWRPFWRSSGVPSRRWELTLYKTSLNALMPTNFSFAAPVLLNISSAKYVDRSARRERWPRHCQTHIHVLFSLLNESKQTIYCVYLSTHLERKHTCRDKHYGFSCKHTKLVLIKIWNKNICVIISMLNYLHRLLRTKLLNYSNCNQWTCMILLTLEDLPVIFFVLPAARRWTAVQNRGRCWIWSSHRPCPGTQCDQIAEKLVLRSSC